MNLSSSASSHYATRSTPWWTPNNLDATEGEWPIDTKRGFVAETKAGGRRLVVAEREPNTALTGSAAPMSLGERNPRMGAAVHLLSKQVGSRQIGFGPLDADAPASSAFLGLILQDGNEFEFRAFLNTAYADMAPPVRALGRAPAPTGSLIDRELGPVLFIPLRDKHEIARRIAREAPPDRVMALAWTLSDACKPSPGNEAQIFKAVGSTLSPKAWLMGATSVIRQRRLPAGGLPGGPVSRDLATLVTQVCAAVCSPLRLLSPQHLSSDGLRQLFSVFLRQANSEGLPHEVTLDFLASASESLFEGPDALVELSALDSPKTFVPGVEELLLRRWNAMADKSQASPRDMSVMHRTHLRRLAAQKDEQVRAEQAVQLMEFYDDCLGIDSWHWYISTAHPDKLLQLKEFRADIKRLNKELGVVLADSLLRRLTTLEFAWRPDGPRADHRKLEWLCLLLKQASEHSLSERVRIDIASNLDFRTWPELSFEAMLASLRGPQATDTVLRAYLDGIHDRHARLGSNPFARLQARTEWVRASRALVNALRQGSALKGPELRRLMSLLLDPSSPLSATECRTMVEQMAQKLADKPRQARDSKSDFLALARPYLVMYRERPGEWKHAVDTLKALGSKAALAKPETLDQWIEHAELECLWTRTPGPLDGPDNADA